MSAFLKTLFGDAGTVTVVAFGDGCRGGPVAADQNDSGGFVIPAAGPGWLRMLATALNGTERTMIGIVKLALRRPYTFVVDGALIMIFVVGRRCARRPISSKHQYPGDQRRLQLYRPGAG